MVGDILKEAYGGLTNLYIFMIFFVIYVCFIAVALNFAKTYRIKNYVISTLEQSQYASGVDEATLGQLDNYLDSVPYTISDDEVKDKCKNYGEPDNVVSHHGVCIIANGEEDSRYYRVVVFFKVEFPFLDINGFYIPVSGETMIIHQPVEIGGEQ